MFINTINSILEKHGITATYTQVSEGVYNLDTGTAGTSTLDYSVKVYMKHMRANQYSFPNLIGKNVGLFYIAAATLLVIPEINDRITYNNKTYTVESVQSHSANGAIVLYRIVGVV